MPQLYIVEHTDAAGIIDIFRYERYGDAKDVADQWWEKHKNQDGHSVKVYHLPADGAPRQLIYTAE
jgi:hypothetical protein